MSKGQRRRSGSPGPGKPRGDKLFHVIVVLGSAMVAGGACGQSKREHVDDGDGRGSGGSGGSGGREQAGSAGFGGVFVVAGMSGSGGIMIEPPTGGTAGNGVTGGTGAVPRECEPAAGGEMQAGGAPNSADDCANSAQFRCVAYEPEPVDCACDPYAPPAPECCTGNTRFFCEGGYDPPLGCSCDFISIITR
jgi:hypothetical protein